MARSKVPRLKCMGAGCACFGGVRIGGDQAACLPGGGGISTDNVIDDPINDTI